MKYTITFWEQLSIRIIILFAIAILSTFIPEYTHGFFGDWFCAGSGRYLGYDNGGFEMCEYNGLHDSTWHWGYRHWIWACMCIVLFIINCIRIVKFISKSKVD